MYLGDSIKLADDMGARDGESPMFEGIVSDSSL
jgi:hypothetical protein